MEVHRGEVFYADLSPVVGSEQGGVRPVLILQNDVGNRHSPPAHTHWPCSTKLRLNPQQHCIAGANPNFG